MNTLKLNNAIGETLARFTQTVSSTLGPCGRSVMIRTDGRVARITKDGVTVANAIKSDDPVQQALIEVIRQASRATVETAGDGTTSTAVIAHSLYDKLSRVLRENDNAVQIQERLEKFNQVILNWIKGNVVMTCDKHDLVYLVAMTSTNGDQIISNLVADAFESVGQDGVVNVAVSNTNDDRLTTTTGMRLETGFSHPAFINVPSMQAFKSECPVYVVDIDVKSNDQLAALYDGLISHYNSPAVFIVENIDDVYVEALAKRMARNGQLLLKAPDFGTRRKMSLDDIAIYCGTQVIWEEDLTKRKAVNDDFAVTTCNILSKRGCTLITNPRTDKDYVEQLDQYRKILQDTRNNFELDGDSYNADVIIKRLARLNSSIADINVGGETDIDAKERKDRFDDAVCAVRVAMKNGIVPGGGWLFSYAIDECAAELNMIAYEHNRLNSAEVIKAWASAVGLAVPTTLLRNGGHIWNSDMAAIHQALIARLLDEGKNHFHYAYNPINGTYEDMVEKGVLDPYGVLESSLKNATSIAINLLFTNYGVVDDL